MRLVKKLEQFEAVFVALQNNMNSNGSSSSTNRGSNSNSNSNHASLHKPAMAGLLNQNQQTTRKNVTFFSDFSAFVATFLPDFWLFEFFMKTNLFKILCFVGI